MVLYTVDAFLFMNKLKKGTPVKIVSYMGRDILDYDFEPPNLTGKHGVIVSDEGTNVLVRICDSNKYSNIVTVKMPICFVEIQDDTYAHTKFIIVRRGNNAEIQRFYDEVPVARFYSTVLGKDKVNEYAENFLKFLEETDNDND